MLQVEPFAETALAKPVRNAPVHTEPFANNALGMPSDETAGRPAKSALRFAVDDSIAARFLVSQN